MATYINFFRDNKPVSLLTINQEICDMLNVEPHDTYYCLHWKDSIAFLMAVGKSKIEIQLALIEAWTTKVPNEFKEEYERSIMILDFLFREFTWNNHKPMTV